MVVASEFRSRGASVASAVAAPMSSSVFSGSVDWRLVARPGCGGEVWKQGLWQGLSEFRKGVGMTLACNNPLLPQPAPWHTGGASEGHARLVACGQPSVARELH